MQEYVQLIALGALLVGVSAAIVARVRRAWLGRTVLLILLAPAIPMVAIFALGSLFSPTNGTVLYGLVFAIMLIGTIVLVPWLLACGIGIAIGLALRSKRPLEPSAPSAPPAPAQSKAPVAVIGPKPEGQKGPAPFATWRTALILLIGALAAIAGLTYLSERYGFDPPSVSTIPHIPRTVP